MEDEQNPSAYRKVISFEGGGTVLARRVDNGFERRDVDRDWCILDDYDVSADDLRNLISNAADEPDVTVHEFGEELVDDDPAKLPMGMPSKYYS